MIRIPFKKVVAAKRVRTRRCVVRQRSSKGKWKTRSIDDFTRSGINWTTRVVRQVRMGKIKDVAAFMQRMRKKFPEARFRI